MAWHSTKNGQSAAAKAAELTQKDPCLCIVNQAGPGSLPGMFVDVRQCGVESRGRQCLASVEDTGSIHMLDAAQANDLQLNRTGVLDNQLVLSLSRNVPVWFVNEEFCSTGLRAGAEDRQRRSQ
eukprot:scpid95254/ scgid21022/ 